MGWLAQGEKVRDTETLNCPSEVSTGLQRGTGPQIEAPLRSLCSAAGMGPLTNAQEIKGGKKLYNNL